MRTARANAQCWRTISALTLLTASLSLCHADADVDASFYTKWRTPEELEVKWRDLAKEYAPLVQLEDIGETFENRTIYALRVGKTDDKAPRRVLLNGLLHAREWASGMAVTYTAEVLAVNATEGDKGDGSVADLLSQVEVLLVPVSNPDGFAFSHTGIRKWRKNRNNPTPGSCRREEYGTLLDDFGVDLDANWGKDFGNGRIVSRDPCADFYTGPEAFSELETRALRGLVEAEANKGILAHLDVESYYQNVIGPWDHTDEMPERVDEIDAVGQAVADAMTAVEDKRYRFGRASKERIYSLHSGTMMDWMFSQGILSFRVNLRPEQHAVAQFALPEAEITPIGKEGAAGALEAIKFAQRMKLDEGGTPTTTGSSTAGSALNESGVQGEAGAEANVENSGNRDTVIAIGTVVGGLVLVTVMGITLCFIRRKRLKEFDMMEIQV